jgi:hypothetical protein
METINQKGNTMKARIATFTKPAMTQKEINAKFNHEYYAANPETAYDDHLAALNELDHWSRNREYKGIQITQKTITYGKRTNADNKRWVFILDGKEQNCSTLNNVKDAIDNHFDCIAHAAKWEAKKAADLAAKVGA